MSKESQPIRHPLDPPPGSLARRAELAKLFSGLRRVRSKTPFFLLAAHRIPTLWGLYRGLRREAPSDEIKWRLRKLFEKNRALTGTKRTIKLLNMGYKWLDTFKRARDGDKHLQSVLERYSKMIAAKREKENWKQNMREEWAWQMRLRQKPILTGSLLAPTLDNPPLPRLYPQPDNISGMIRQRKRARLVRLQRQRRLFDMQEDLSLESQFEDNLHRELAGKRTEANAAEVERVFSGEARNAWRQSIQTRLDIIEDSWKRDQARLRTPISPELFATLAAARKYKIENKTREKERQRKGVITKKTLERARGGPPAHLLAKLSEEQREVDKIVRLPGEAGYVGAVKRKVGVKLRDDVTWRLEEEAGEQGVKREKSILEENERRRGLHE
ncbi:hypothetical protein H1R20_g13578, partial [Candolleomyces eurysporus]